MHRKGGVQRLRASRRQRSIGRARPLGIRASDWGIIQELAWPYRDAVVSICSLTGTQPVPNNSERDFYNKPVCKYLKYMVPGTGVEPVRCCHRGILSSFLARIGLIA